MAKNKLAKLDYRFVDDAIDLIEKGRFSRTCLALNSATQGEANPGRYSILYQEFTSYDNGGHLPHWWDGTDSRNNRYLRVSALRAFRAAIQAAQRKNIKQKPSLEDMVKKARKHLIKAQEMLNKINDEFES